jgi:hypothetical protein
VDTKHLEPQSHGPCSQPERRPRTPSRLPLLKAGLWAAALIVAGGTFANRTLHTAPDAVPASTQAQLQQAFAVMKPVRLELVAAADIQKALDSLALLPDQRRALEQRLTVGQQMLGVSVNTAPASMAWVDLWDFAQEDGDVVRLASAGFETEVRLQKAHSRIAIPVDASYKLTITGIHDGGGGITLGIATQASPVSLPVLAPGQMINVPLVL